MGIVGFHLMNVPFLFGEDLLQGGVLRSQIKREIMGNKYNHIISICFSFVL